MSSQPRQQVACERLARTGGGNRGRDQPGAPGSASELLGSPCGTHRTQTSCKRPSRRAGSSRTRGAPPPPSRRLRAHGTPALALDCKEQKTSARNNVGWYGTEAEVVSAEARLPVTRPRQRQRVRARGGTQLCNPQQAVPCRSGGPLPKQVSWPYPEPVHEALSRAPGQQGKPFTAASFETCDETLACSEGKLQSSM